MSSPETPTLETDVKNAGFASVNQAIDGMLFLSEPLDEFVKKSEPESNEEMRRLLENAKPGTPGINIRDYEFTSASGKELVWCDDTGKPRGIALVYYKTGADHWAIGTITVDQTLPKQERRPIAEAMYAEFFRHDWMRNVSGTLSPAARRATQREFLKRITRLSAKSTDQLLAMITHRISEDGRGRIRALLDH